MKENYQAVTLPTIHRKGRAPWRKLEEKEEMSSFNIWPARSHFCKIRIGWVADWAIHTSVPVKIFKGTGSPDRFQIFWQKLTDQGLNKGRSWFLNFLGLLWFNIKIKLFLQVNAQLGWLDNVSGVPREHFSLLLIGQQGLGHFLRHRPLTGRFCRRYSKRQGKLTCKMPLTLREAP